jgi:rhamnosyltransferase
MTPAVSVVVRAKNEEESIGRVLDIVNGQQLDGEVEVLVVDSGSTDRTADIARDRGAEHVWIPPESFTFGGSLNTGCEVASAPIIVALSAHAFPPDSEWLARMLACFEDPRVACAYGSPVDPRGDELRERRVQDLELARQYPHWGYGNVAGGFRAELWRQRRFRPDMPGTEDKEWAWHWLHRGYVVVMDPSLKVGHSHWRDPLPDIYRRFRREWEGYAMYLDMEPYPFRDLVRDWWSDDRGYRSRLRARLSYRRAAMLAGRWAGMRSVDSRRQSNGRIDL